MLPFNVEEFISVFTRYNAAIWPTQIAAYLLGIAAVVLVARKALWSDRLIQIALAAMWLWTGLFYHATFFSTINPAAYLFGVLFAAQGLLFLAGAWRGRVRFGTAAGLPAWLGWFLIVYAMVLYPLIGLASGHRLLELPMFGVTPCPVTIFTFGLLLLGTPTAGAGLLAIPFLWSLVGGSAAFLLAIPQDWLLLLSGLVAVPVIMLYGRRNRTPA